jgi:DeoR/GlpR family transcriptional regulator of sugar metabolism
MAKDELKIDSRRRRILELIRGNGQVKIAELARMLDTTIVTVRNDLAILERDGYCTRVSGGAIRSAPKFTGLEFRHRAEQRGEQKQLISATAAQLVHDGDTLMINSGTTTYLTGLALKQRKNLSIVTNSLPIAVEMSTVTGFRVLLLGGTINPEFAFSFGSTATAELLQYKADSAILAVDGISATKGITTRHPEEAEINRVMMERSRRTLVVADSSKIEREGFFKFATLSADMHFLTDAGGDPGVLEEFEQHGVKIHICEQ